jgi:hypothetical protein
MQRGVHNITDEITYESNPDFVFHDSGGFEAGSEEEINIVWAFIRERSLTSSPATQLHAIWYVFARLSGLYTLRLTLITTGSASQRITIGLWDS